MKKFFKEIEEQYVYLWWWLLNQGLVIATILVNTFMLTLFTIVMTGLYFFIRWYSRH